MKKVLITSILGMCIVFNLVISLKSGQFENVQLSSLSKFSTANAERPGPNIVKFNPYNYNDDPCDDLGNSVCH